jgi:hypothetical protein
MTPPVKVPMNMPYDAQDGRARLAGEEHARKARLAQALRMAADLGATVEEVKAAFPEVAADIDRVLAERASSSNR